MRIRVNNLELYLRGFAGVAGVLDPFLFDAPRKISVKKQLRLRRRSFFNKKQYAGSRGFNPRNPRTDISGEFLTLIFLGAPSRSTPKTPQPPQTPAQT
jgi:hypothetical protein